jgi:hypothetical protein
MGRLEYHVILMSPNTSHTCTYDDHCYEVSLISKQTWVHLVSMVYLVYQAVRVRTTPRAYVSLQVQQQHLLTRMLVTHCDSGELTNRGREEAGRLGKETERRNESPLGVDPGTSGRHAEQPGDDTCSRGRSLDT